MTFDQKVTIVYRNSEIGVCCSRPEANFCILWFHCYHVEMSWDYQSNVQSIALTTEMINVCDS